MISCPLQSEVKRSRSDFVESLDVILTNSGKIDGNYQFDGLDAGTILDEVYPALVDQFESKFEESQIQYYEVDEH